MMKAIENNPFRILGLPVTASVREIEKRATELETYASMGKTKTYDTDFDFKPVDRTLESVIEARKRLQLDEEKFRNSFFWFWSNNSIDELALDLLRDGSVDKAIAIWEKAVFTNKRDVYIKTSVIEDLISESSGWPEFNDDNQRAEIEGDTFIIERKTEQATTVTTFAEFEDSDRWLIECDAEWMGGEDEYAFGLIWGRGGNSYYSFEISANGYLRVGRTVNGKFGSIIEWTTGGDHIINCFEINHIQAERKVNELILRINGFIVETIPYEPFFGTSFGFKVYGQQTVRFTGLKLSKFRLDDSYASGVEITNKNVSCAKNLALLHLYQAASHGILKFHLWMPSIALFEKFVSSEYFDEYVKSVAGEKFVPDWNETVDYYNRVLVENLNRSLNKTYGVTTSSFIDSFSVFPNKNFQAVKNLFVAGRIQKINKAVSKAEERRKADSSKAVDSGLELISSIENDVEQLSKALGKSSIEYQLASDKVVDELVLSGIAHYNSTQDDEPGLPLYKYATTIAVTPKAIERAKENLRTCKISVQQKHIHKLIEKSRNLRQASPQTQFRPVKP